MAQTEPKTLGEKLLSIPKWALFLILAIGTSVPLFFNVPLPNKPDESSKDLYRTLMKLGPDSRILIQSDWTESTRGENRGHMDALLRILMRRQVKFAVQSMDPQGPLVAQNVIRDLNAERKEANLPEYVRGVDWVSLGYYPNAENHGKAMAANFRDAIGPKQDGLPGQETPVFQSEILKDVQKVGDLDLMIVVTGSKTITVALERLYGKVPMAGMVTGVMGPETNNYYVSGQLEGLAAGLKGVYDMEMMMDKGLPAEGPNPAVEGFPNMKNLDKGTQYILTLHVAIGLLILAVVIGNVGVALSRGGKNR